MNEETTNEPASDLSAPVAGNDPEEHRPDAPEEAMAQAGDLGAAESDDSGESAESAADAPESAAVPAAGRRAHAAAASARTPAEEKMAADFGWYILHTLSGNEEKVRQTMVTTLAREGLAECMQDVLIPVEDVVEVKRGKKHIKKRKLFPGYVFVRMKATEPVLKQIRRLPNLARFVGGIGGSGPVPVTDAEIGRIRVFMTETKERPKIIYEVGETVRIINGPFMDFNGTILEMDVDRGRLKIQVEIFGRATPVDLDFDQVEKV